MDLCPKTTENLRPKSEQVFADNILSLKRKILLSLKSEQVYGCVLLDKIAELMLNKSDKSEILSFTQKP